MAHVILELETRVGEGDSQHQGQSFRALLLPGIRSRTSPDQQTEGHIRDLRGRSDRLDEPVDYEGRRVRLAIGKDTFERGETDFCDQALQNDVDLVPTPIVLEREARLLSPFD